MKVIADLHTHSNKSDGVLSPAQLIDKAVARGLGVVALTDHNTLSGLREAEDYSKGKPIRFVPGVEFSCTAEDINWHEIHVLGLFINYESPSVVGLSEKVQAHNVENKKQIIKKLNKLGYEICFGELEEKFGGNISRMKIAELLLSKYPELKDLKNIFKKLVGFGKPAFVIPKRPLINEVVEAIRLAGGLSFLAHPKSYIHCKEIIGAFVEAGGEGIEVNYPYKIINGLENEAELIKELKEVVVKHNLLVSGGADFHGGMRPVLLGERGLSGEEFEELLGKVNA